MANGKPWLKMWTSWLGDIQLDRLSLAEQGAYWRLFSLCHDCGHVDSEGKLTGALILGGIPLTLAEIMKSLKVSDEPDRAYFLSMIEKMRVAGYLYYNGDTLYVTHYEESQRAATDTKADRARRQRERRERLAERENNTSHDSPSLSLGEEIRSYLIAVPLFDSLMKEHESMKNELERLGTAKGYTIRRELPVSDGRIDICWEQEGQIIAAFEIDAVNPKYKSLLKLRNLGAPSFIILRRAKNSFQWEQDILLIGLNRPRPSDEITENQEIVGSPTPPPIRNKRIEDRGQTGNGKSHGKAVTQSHDSGFPRNGNSVTDENISETLKEMMRCFEKYIGGIINSIISGEVTELSEFFDKNGGKFEWIEKGFSAAPPNIKEQKRRWQYTQKVLQNYIDEGGPGERKKQQRDAADKGGAKRHTGEEYRRSTRRKSK